MESQWKLMSSLFGLRTCIKTVLFYVKSQIHHNGEKPYFQALMNFSSYLNYCMFANYFCKASFNNCYKLRFISVLKNLKNTINFVCYFYQKIGNYPNTFFTKVIKQICFKSFLRGLLAKLSLEGEENLLIILTLKGKACLPIQTFYLFFPKKRGGILSLFY